MTARFISISKAAKILKVSPDTLRNWEKQDKLIPSRTSGGARRYSLDQLETLAKQLHPLSKTRGMLSVSKVAKALQVSNDTIRNWEEKRIIEAVRTKGGARRFSRAEIKRLQDELGIQAQVSTVHTQPKVKTARFPIPWFRFLTLATFFIFVFTLSLIAFSFTDQLKKDHDLDKKAKDVLGEHTQDLQNQISQLAGVVETLQKSLYDVQSASLNQVTYIYPPDHLQAVNLGDEAKTSYRVVGQIDSNLIPSVTDKYNLGSLEKSLHQGFVNNIKGKEADYEVVKASSIETSTLGLNNTRIFAGDGAPASNLGSSGDYYFRKDGGSLNSSLYFKANISWQTFDSQSLQTVYQIDNNIVTVDARDIKITLADTTNDSSFNITMAGENSFRVNDDGTFNDPTPFIIDSNGNVGIGNDQPVTKLHIVDDQTSSPAGVTIKNNNSSPNVDLFRIISDLGGPDNVKARITSSGDLFLDGALNSTGADVAEEYNVLDDSEEGNVVVSDGGTEVIKSFHSYQQGILGVISKKPGLILSLKKEDTFSLSFNPKPIAQNGRVPVKVSTENGPIKVGDYLTSSSTPGVAMKATHPGQMVGKALEAFPANTSEVGSDSSEVKSGKILVFVNVSFADPNQVLANLSLDDQGALVVPKIKTATISLGRLDRVNLDIPQDQQSASQIAKPNTPILVDSTAVDVASKLATVESRVKSQESKLDTLLANLATREASTSGQVTGNRSSTPRSLRSSIPRSLRFEELEEQQNCNLVPSACNLNLTPPDILLATGSATLADLKVTNTLSSNRLLTALDATISGVFKALGNSFLGNTTIAGDLVVDGTFSVSQNSINVVGTPNCHSGLSRIDSGVVNTPQNDTCGGILYIQPSPLAEAVDLFNGKVVVDKQGNLRAQTITVAEFKVVAHKISGNGQIKAGSSSVEVKNTLVHPNSRILITPTSQTDLVLAVTSKSDGESFTVSSSMVATSDISFDWWMVNEISQ